MERHRQTDNTEFVEKCGRQTGCRVGAPPHFFVLYNSCTTFSTDDKIAKMEAKLRQLEHTSVSGTSVPTHRHPSLPAKPIAATLAAASVDSSRPSSRPKKTQTPLPALPLAPPSATPSSSASATLRQAISTSTSGSASHKSKSSLAGVVMKKRKE